MNDPLPQSNPHATSPRRHEAVECPLCGEQTVPNRLADASYVCSCPVQRALPLDGGPDPAWMPPPVDEPFFTPGATENPMPPPNLPAPAAAGTEEGRARPPLPEDRGQFGTNIATEAYEPLPGPPGES
jgi:hypothetical protein